MKSYDGQLLLPFDFPEQVYIRDTATMTEQTFISSEKQIAAFIRSGENLAAARRSDFEFFDDDIPDDVQPDPTQRLGYDLADWSRDSYLLKSRQAARGAARDVEGVPGETESSVPGETSEDSVVKS